MADVSRLPGPNADFWDWQLRGSCRGTDSDLFFHPEGERGQARSSREESAKEVCLHCPVCKPCQEHALKVHEPYGVWGGMTEEEREEHYAREKTAVRAARVAAVAAASASASASAVKAGGKPAKPGRTNPIKAPAKAPAKTPAVASAPANAITLTRPGSNTGPGAASAARGTKAKVKSGPAK